jgi:hypothetical protein
MDTASRREGRCHVPGERRDEQRCARTRVWLRQCRVSVYSKVLQPNTTRCRFLFLDPGFPSWAGPWSRQRSMAAGVVAPACVGCSDWSTVMSSRSDRQPIRGDITLGDRDLIAHLQSPPATTRTPHDWGGGRGGELFCLISLFFLLRP